MMRNIVPAILALAIFTTFTAAAQYKMGDIVTGFSLKNVDGRKISLDTSARGYIIIFTCNHCPFAKRYQQRMNAFYNKYKERGIPLIAISANDATAIPEDSYEQMVVRAKQERYYFPYLYDETQTVARAFGAVKTPQAYVVFRENGQWRLRYSGAIDDNGAEPENVQRHYLEDAVDALLSGRPVTINTTRSVGCSIKWKQ